MTPTDVERYPAVAPHAPDFQTVSLRAEANRIVVEEEPDGDSARFAAAAVGGEVKGSGTL
jgi:hypothetical protein